MKDLLGTLTGSLIAGLMGCLAACSSTESSSGALVPTSTVSLEASAPSPSSVPLPSSASSAVGPTLGEGDLRCACGILDFETDGPPRGTCVFHSSPDGSATLESRTGEPRFTARLRPDQVRKPGERAYYAYEGTFDFFCSASWCGPQELSVLELESHDFRVVVERSPDGPPSQVLWVTCR